MTELPVNPNISDKSKSGVAQLLLFLPKFSVALPIIF